MLVAIEFMGASVCGAQPENIGQLILTLKGAVMIINHSLHVRCADRCVAREWCSKQRSLKNSVAAFNVSLKKLDDLLSSSRTFKTHRDYTCQYTSKVYFDLMRTLVISGRTVRRVSGKGCLILEGAVSRPRLLLDNQTPVKSYQT